MQIGGATSAVLGAGGLAVSNGNVAAAINAIPGFAGTVTSAGAGNGGFTLTFAGASAGVDVPPVEIVNCTGTCVASVRETANGGPPLATLAGRRDRGGRAGSPRPASRSRSAARTRAPTSRRLTISDGAVTETVKGAPAMLPPGATVTVAAWGGAGRAERHRLPGHLRRPASRTRTSTRSSSSPSTARAASSARPPAAARSTTRATSSTATGNHAPVVETAAGYTIPLRTPFALTGSATDFDGDTLTYMWEQNDRGGSTSGGTALVSNVKANGPLFRQFGTAANVSATDTLLSPSPGLNAVDTEPDPRVPGHRRRSWPTTPTR